MKPRNATSTPASSLLRASRRVRGWSYVAAAEGFAVSVRCQCIVGFREGGVAAREDASSRPDRRRIRRHRRPWR